MGRGNAHLLQENIGDLLVVVLASVNEDGLDFRVGLHFAHEWGDFGEVRRRPDNIEDFQALAHWMFDFDGKTEYTIRVLGIRNGVFAIRTKKALVRCKGVCF